MDHWEEDFSFRADIDESYYVEDDDIALFNVTHITKGGNTLFVKDMDNSHLINTIRLLIRNAEVVNLEKKENLTKVSSLTYKKKITKTQKEVLVNKFNRHIYKYIAEASIRGLDIEFLLKQIREIFGREIKE